MFTAYACFDLIGRQRKYSKRESPKKFEAN